MITKKYVKELQSRIAKLDKICQRLSRVVVKQNKQIVKLRARK